jgi:hypothetical protein
MRGTKSFGAGNDLIRIFDAEYKTYPPELVFEQGGGSKRPVVGRSKLLTQRYKLFKMSNYLWY